MSVGGMLYFDRLSEDEGALSAVSSAAIQPITSSAGQIGTDDARRRHEDDAWVRRRRSSCPIAFPDKVRVIKVEGTAQFDVAPVADKQACRSRRRQARTGASRPGRALPSRRYADRQRHDGARQGGDRHGQGREDVEHGEREPGGDRRQRDDSSGHRRGARRALGLGERHDDGDGQALREVVATLTRWGFDVKVPDLPLLDRDASINVPFDSRATR